jgi:hypothetical protein
VLGADGEDLAELAAPYAMPGASEAQETGPCWKGGHIVPDSPPGLDVERHAVP